MSDMDLEFDAPQHFLDFRNLSDADSDLESYFDVDHEAPEREAVQQQQQAKHIARHGTPAVKRSMQQLRDITNSPGESGRSRSGCKKLDDRKRTASVDSAIDDSAAPPLPSRRRRSRSHNSALSVVRSAPLSLSQTPNVLRQGMALRSAARAAAQRAVDDEEQRRQEVFRRQMREFKRRAAESTAGRHAAPQPVRALPATSCTLPQPFSFQQRPGGSATAASSVQYKPVAQQVNDFQRKTPERFHSRPANGAAAAVNVVEENAGARGVTRGRTPQLATRTRRGRSADLLSTEQLQLLEFQRCQQQAVKPVPLNQNLLQQPLGVPAKQRRPSTAPKPFNLTATQLPAYKQSVRRKRSGSADTDPDRHIQPNFKRSRRSASCDRAGSTRPQPFSFQQRDQQRAEMKQRKIEQVLAEERRLREFRAQLLPSPTPRGIPDRAARPTTRPRPFNLPGLQIHNEAADKHRQKLEEEAAAAEAARQFRAQSCSVTSRAPFQPLPAAHPSTEQLPIRLHSDQRAEQRREFDQLLKQREAELQQQRQKLEEDRRAREECEVQRLRRAAVHRARPVPEYRTFVPQPSSRPLTDANTPSFSRKPAH